MKHAGAKSVFIYIVASVFTLNHKVVYFTLHNMLCECSYLWFIQINSYLVQYMNPETEMDPNCFQNTSIYY